MPTTKHMDVKVRHGFAAGGTIVDDDAEAVVEFLGGGHLAGHQQKVTKDDLILVGGFAHANDEFLWNYEGMRGSLRVHVANGHALVVLMDEFGGNPSICTHDIGVSAIRRGQ